MPNTSEAHLLAKLDPLVRVHGADLVERHLVHSFCMGQALDPTPSEFLAAYFAGPEPVPGLLKAIEPLDLRSLKQLEKTLELLIPSEDRTVNGAFFTPGVIVDFIVREIGPHANGTYLDPSCGCGAFLVGTLDHLHRQGGMSVRELVRRCIHGADILEYNVRRTKVILALYGLMHGEVLGSEDFNIVHCDSLGHDWGMIFDGIVGNPPYVKFQDLSEANRERLEADWSTIRGGTFNLYFAFFELGIRLLKPQGMLGYITPNNYFTSLAGEPLRAYLQHGRHVRKVLDFGHRRVFAAQTYTAITFLTKAPQDTVLFDRITEDQAIGDFLSRHAENRNPVATLDPRKWRLLKEADMHNVRRIERAGTAIGSMFDIVVGIATLKDAVFFVTGYEEDGEHLRITKDGGTWSIEKAITRPVYKISEMKTEADIARNRRRIICPYRIERKAATAIPESDMERDFPGCLDYLRAHRAVLQERDKGKVAYSPFYAWGRTQGLTRRGLKLIVPTFSKAPRFLRVIDEDAFFTNGYGIHLREQEPGLLGHADPLLREENLDVTARILNSVVMDYYVRMTSVFIHGGYPCYQKNFIERFSIPELTDGDMDAMRNASDAAFTGMLWDAYGLDRAVMEAFLVDREQVAGEPVPAQG